MIGAWATMQLCNHGTLEWAGCTLAARLLDNNNYVYVCVYRAVLAVG